MILRLPIWLVLLGGLWTTPAIAHPHILVDSYAILEFQDGKIVALTIGWRFDPAYSSSLVQDFDADKSGTLSPAEIAEMEKDAFRTTAKHSYFTYGKVDGAAIQWLPAEKFSVMVHENALVYHFRLPLPQPVDPRRQNITLSTYEESYYMDIDFPGEQAITMTGDGSAGCRARMAPDKSNRLYGGLVIPNKVSITCP